jgi:hypothetical protein
MGVNGLSTFDQVTNKRLDISPVLSAILLNDTATLGLIGQGPAVSRSEFQFGEDTLNPPSVTDNGTGIAGAGTLAMSVLDTSKIRAGALLMDEANAVTEIIRVDSVDSATDLTISRGYGGTTAVAHAANAKYAIIGQPVLEGDEEVSDISRDRTKQDNYTQIFKSTVKITGTQEAEANNGIHPGVDSELRLQIARRAMELSVELNRAVLNSYASAVTPAGSSTVQRTMKGIRQWLTEGGADSNHNSTVEALDEDVVNALFKACWDKGGMPSHLLGNAEQINKFASFNSNKFRIAPSDRVLGVFIEKYLTEFGAEISLVLDRWARKDEVYLIDPSKFSVVPLQGRQMFTEPLARIGDTLRWQMVMELSTKCENKNEAHAMHSALTA